MSDATSDVAVLKPSLQARISELHPSLVELSEWLHAHPETAWEEHESAARCAA